MRPEQTIPERLGDELMAEIEVNTEQADGGWICRVRVQDPRGTSRHEVRVSQHEMERFGRGRSVAQTVQDSIRFLLQREPPQAILQSFSLSTIQRYFPDFEGGP